MAVKASSTEGPGEQPSRDDAPQPRRTRSGAVIIGPSIAGRYRPGALIGLPLVSVLLSPFAGAGLQQWRRGRLGDGHDGLLEQLLAPAWTQLLVGAALLWALFALWGLIPVLVTHRVALLDEADGTLGLRRGLRVVDRARVAEVDYAVGEAERGSLALIGLQQAGGTSHQWVIPEIGWDSASFDGLRVLQGVAGLRPAPSRAVLVDLARSRRRVARDRELAARLGMPWHPCYEDDAVAFRTEFDRVRRVLGGQEPARPGDPKP